MKTSIVLSAALVAGVFFASAPMQAQAPALSNTQNLEGKIASLQAQVDVLQAQVKRLQGQLRAASPSATAGRVYQIPNIQVPNYQAPNYQAPNYQIQPFPNFGGPGGFGGQGFSAPQLQLPAPRLYSNIPPCTITFISQKPR